MTDEELTQRLSDRMDQIVAQEKARVDCWCQDTRKSCQYHDGMEYGIELALAEMARQEVR